MTNDESTLLAMFMVGGAVAIAVAIVAVLVYIVTCLGMAKMFKKAGEPAWKAYVPFYNLYILYKKCWQTKMFWILFVTSLIGGILNNMSEDSIIVLLLSLVFSIIGIVIEAKFCGRLSRAYGKKTGTAIGYFFLPTIFSWILGFGSAQYTAPEEV